MRFGARSVDGAPDEVGIGDGPSAALKRVVRMLDDIGFQPELAPGSAEIRCATARSTSWPAIGRR